MVAGASVGIVPKPDRVVDYFAYSTPRGKPNGKLFVFGDLGSAKMALLCAGFADDHTIFLPFAKALSEEGGLLVGVMCLPGFDDRPEDGIPWQSHPRKIFSCLNLVLLSIILELDVMFIRTYSTMSFCLHINMKQKGKDFPSTRRQRQSGRPRKL